MVFQHVLAGPLSISALAERMGVAQQAASKAVADLERRGLLRRAPDPAEARPLRRHGGDPRPPDPSAAVRRSSSTASRTCSCTRTSPLIGAAVEIKRVIADEDHAVVHLHLLPPGDDRGIAIVDIVRVEDGLIKEHWDVKQPVPPAAETPHGMF